MKKWILLLSIFLSVMTATAYSEQALHEDALVVDPLLDEALFDHGIYLNDFEEGPLPLPDDPPAPGDPPNEPVPPGGPQSFTLGTGQATRFGSRSYSFYPHISKMISLRVIAGKTNIEVKHVWVTYTDTMRTVEISQLRGELSRSRAKEVRMSGRAVFRVDIEVSASSFWRQPGYFHMSGTSLP
ncbi:hypothetical protein D3C87_1198070 [compost metagenome]